MGPTGWSMPTECRRCLWVGALQTATIGRGNTDLGEGAGLDRCDDRARHRRRSPDGMTTSSPSAAGVYVAMGQDPATHGGEPFGQLYLAMADFGSNQGWSVAKTPRLIATSLATASPTSLSPEIGHSQIELAERLAAMGRRVLPIAT